MFVGAVASDAVSRVAIVIVSGATNGIASFGFALIGTMALATMLDPATAVVFMIVPILAVNVSLVRDLSRRELRSCSRRFWPVIAAALVGTIAGMAVLDSVPQAPLRLGLGVLTLGFVSTAQRRVPLPGISETGTRDVAKTRLGMAGVGAVSGVVFGGTNVGVQLIAYLRSFDLSHGLFVGVVALVFLGLNGIRVAIAGAFGLYPNPILAAASAVAVIPAVAGVAIGKRLRAGIDERFRRALVLGLLTVVGLRLLTGGLGVT
ncbi:sulfite exporter TauE/SafE family protein [Natronomonas salsuginis]|uniref:Probable membrane transporter protein n=1 Tax=Natronomonas salsuginis TaxID=2217661 RepID=A0A4U5JI65_9EURY|nr:sulfite exporter TauE/SafE family protein [Natronomonas salsuginis]